MKTLKIWHRKVSEGRAYQVSIALQSNRKPSPHSVALLDWMPSDDHFRRSPFDDETLGPDIPLKRVFLDRTAQGWTGVHLAPPGAVRLRVGIHHWSQLAPPPSYVCRLECGETPRPPVQHRRLAVAYQKTSASPTMESNLRIMMDAVREADCQKVDLLCMSENFLDRGVSIPQAERARAMDDPLLKTLLEVIASSGVHVVFTFHEKFSRKFHTTAVLASPEGKVMGRYRKRHLALPELEQGQTPGRRWPVYDTPLGKIGMLVCWDMWFPESMLALTTRGAEIVCAPIAGDGEEIHWQHIWKARAMDNQSFLLTSITGNCGGRAPSQIVAPNGVVLAETRKPNTLAVAEVALPFKSEPFHILGPSFSETRNVFAHSRF